MPSEIPSSNPLSYLGVQAEKPPNVIRAQRAPLISDLTHTIGDIWIDEVANEFYVFTSSSNGQARWESPATSGLPPISEFVVDGSGSATYLTVQEGMDAASAAGGGAVWVRPGTYTEDLTIPVSVQLVGAVGNSDSVGPSSVEIIGIHTVPTIAGVNVFKNITFTSSTSIFSGASDSQGDLIVENCKLQVLNGFIFELLNWQGAFILFNVSTGSSQDGVVDNAADATCLFISGTIGAGTTHAMSCDGSIIFEEITMNAILSVVSSSSARCSYSRFNNPVNLTGTGTGTFLHCEFDTTFGAPGVAITMSSSNPLIVSHSDINSPSGSDAIGGAGAGLVTLNNTSFRSSHDIAAALTLDNVQRTIVGGLQIVSGTDATVGTAVLGAGTVTVFTTSVTTSSLIFLTKQVAAGGTGGLTVGVIVDGVSFDIDSSSGTDTSTAAWMIVEPV